MATKKMRVVPYRRKREGKTNYKKRLKLLLSSKPRFIVRKSLKNMLIQIAEYNDNGDKILVSISSKVLEKNYGWKAGRGNIPAAYLTGLVAGHTAKQKGISEAILDTGLQQSSVKGAKIYAAVKGAIDGGLHVPCSEEMIPAHETLAGKKIVEYAALLKKSNPEKYRKQFSEYLTKNIDPEHITCLFEETKKKIIKG
jgi:large subunit ribosomal protein L18